MDHVGLHCSVGNALIVDFDALVLESSINGAREAPHRTVEVGNKSDVEIAYGTAIT